MKDTNDAQRRYEESREAMGAECERQMNKDLARMMVGYCNDYHRLRVNQAYKWDVEGLRQDGHLLSNITECGLLTSDIELLMDMLAKTPSRELVLISADLMDAAAKTVAKLTLRTMFSKEAAHRYVEPMGVASEPMNDAEAISLCNGVFMPSLQPIAAEVSEMGKRAKKAAVPENDTSPFVLAELVQALNCTRWMLQAASSLHNGYGDFLEAFGPPKNAKERSDGDERKPDNSRG